MVVLALSSMASEAICSDGRGAIWDMKNHRSSPLATRRGPPTCLTSFTVHDLYLDRSQPPSSTISMQFDEPLITRRSFWGNKTTTCGAAVLPDRYHDRVWLPLLSNQSTCSTLVVSVSARHTLSVIQSDPDLSARFIVNTHFSTDRLKGARSGQHRNAKFQGAQQGSPLLTAQSVHVKVVIRMRRP